jgi:hypothetical protein
MEENHEMFINLHRNGQLTKPEYPAHVIVALANSPPKEFSGKMCNWNDEQMKPYCRA